jgi:hypothetical protein
MASASSVDTISLLFSASWCEPCKKIKPIYETNIRPVYLLNGISCYELSYNSNDTKELMERLDIHKIPSLCIINLSKTWSPDDDPCGDNLDSLIIKKQILNSSEIEHKALDMVHSFSVEDDF